MKKMRRFLLIISIFYASQAFAFIPPPGPISPVIDVVNDVIQTGKALMKKFRTVADQAQYYRDQALNAIKSAKNFIHLDLSESPLQKEDGQPVLAAAKEIVESDLGNIKSEEDVSNIFQELFLTYPIDLIESFPAKQREVILRKYHDKSVEFSNDNMMELYLTIRDLEENRLPAMKKELDDLSDCFVAGKSGDSTLCGSASDTDEELGNAVNKYKLAEAQDSYLRMYQELVALKIQYEASLALQEGVSPFNEDEALSTSPSEEQVSAVTNPSFNLEKPDIFKEKTPFEGAEENLTALPILDGIYDLLSEAQYLHNTKQQLPNLRRPFLEYEKMDALHRVSVEKVVESEGKVRDYFANYYQDADSLWFGDGCSLRMEYIGRRCPNITGCKSVKEYVKYESPVILCPNAVFQVTEYDKIRGLSKDAYDLYTGAKVEQVLDLNDSDEEPNSQNQIDGVAVVDMEMDTTTPDVDEEVDLEGMVGSEEDLVKGSDISYAEGAVREQDLNRWQIGSIEALKVGSDMNSGSSRYGLKSKYPLWQDEMRFYDQYLREKYKNMELHFNSPIIAKPMYELARQMNDDLDVTAEARAKCHEEPQKRKQYKFDHVCFKDVTYKGYKLECDENGENCHYVSVTRCCKKEVDSACRSNAVKVAQQEEDACNKQLNEQLKIEKQGNNDIINKSEEAFNNDPLIQKFLTSSELEELKRQQEQDFAALEETHKGNLLAALSKRNAASNALNAVMDKLNAEKKQYNDLMGQKKDAESEAEAQDQVMELGDKKAKENPDTPYITDIPNEAKAKQNEKRQEAINAANSAQGHKSKITAYEKEVKQYNKQIKEAEEEIEAAKQDYILRAVILEGEQMEAMKEKLANRIKEIKALPLPSFGGGTQTIGTIASFAQTMYDTFKTNAISEVVSAYHEIEGLGKNKYEASLYNSGIYPIHKRMIDNIEHVVYPSLVSKLGVVHAGADVISGAFLVKASVALAQKTFASIALNSECDSRKEDAEFFVSLKGRSCDLTAPKRYFVDRTPPVREVFYFDTADYDALVKTEGKTSGLLQKLELPRTTRYEFLNLGREMPRIWKLILEPNGFVERDVDVEDVLNQGNNITQRNAGEFHAFVRSRIKTEPEKESMGSEEFLHARGEMPVFGDAGELSVFLKYDKGLVVRETIFALADYFDYVATTKKKIDEKDVKSRKKTLLLRNQVGDFLQFVDIEQTYRTQLVQLKVKVNEGRRTIEDALEKSFCVPKKKDVGYVKDSEVATKFVSSEFIADDEVYDSVAKCLDQGKNMYIAEAVKMMKTLPQLTDYLQGRKKKLDDMLKVMQIDSDELVQISDNTEPNGEFEEKIKSEKVDGEVVGRYGDEAEEEFENNKNNFEVPYQARYF